MRRVRCGECGKRYDFDTDDFCPRCGAFNSPPRSSCIGVDGSVIRLYGLNEENHRNSFVHAELHEENRKRRASELSKSVKRAEKTAPVRKVRRPHEEKSAQSLGHIIKLVIAAIIGLNILSSLLSSLF